MIGIEFEINNEYEKFLSKILSNINTDQYNWYIPFEDVIEREGNSFFSKNLYVNNDFRKKIKEKHYIIHFICLGFSDEKIVDLKNYKEFLDSSCNIVISIIDSTMVKIYCKEVMTLKKIEENAKINNFINIKYINDQEQFKNIIMISQ